MPLITPLNANIGILNNIIDWLSQIKLATVSNQRVEISEFEIIGDDGFDLGDLTLAELNTLTQEQLAQLPLDELDASISFYLDAARTQLIFTANTGANASDFSINQNKLYFTPPDSLINSATALSTTLNQPLYYWTATFNDPYGEQTFGEYKNSLNLMFQSVICANKYPITFSKNENQAVIVPGVEKQDRKKSSDPVTYLISPFDVNLQLIIPRWDNLDEVIRIQTRQQVTNAIRTALYSDRGRGGYATFYDKEIAGTLVGDFTPAKSDAVLLGRIVVKTCTMIANDQY
jgi:hypothetical protein